MPTRSRLLGSALDMQPIHHAQSGNSIWHETSTLYSSCFLEYFSILGIDDRRGSEPTLLIESGASVTVHHHSLTPTKFWQMPRLARNGLL